MIIKCRRLINPVTRKQLDTSPWFTIDKEYVVLMLGIDPKVGISVVVHSDHHYEPIFPSLEGFEIISQCIPSNWGTKIGSDNNYYLMPKSWMYKEFLEEIEEERPEAVELFVKEAEIIYQEEGREYWKEGEDNF